MRCVALLSGGLDSHLAVRLMQQQGLEVVALHCRSPFAVGPDRAEQAATCLGVPLTIVSLGDDYLDIVRQPRFGYGRGANPCVDCRVHMFSLARSCLQQHEAQFVVSGEVVGQRAGSQKRRDLDTIAHHSGLHERLLRPLSARLLPVTLPERAGWVDREKLYGFYGRGRRGLIQLARALGIDEIPTPSTGCVLTEPPFARKVFDLLQHQTRAGRWDFELLKFGRHFRLNNQCKVVLGRREAENHQLEHLHAVPEAGESTLLAPDGFVGPTALVVGPLTDQAYAFACELMHQFARKPIDPAGRVRVRCGDASYCRTLTPDPRTTAAQRNIADVV
ncbi:MAG: tRNA 4-thiouridine(8) synthase ThiI [Planctomycetaceae bacterium]|nr:tRNA 4-thiouridine(8) synthase ThiI [Planctomycetaceae bacterium]